jgi:hypothetical protein
MVELKNNFKDDFINSIKNIKLNTNDDPFFNTIKKPIRNIFSIIWFALFGLIIYYNGGFGYITNPISLTLCIIALSLAVFISWGPVYIIRIRQIICEPLVNFKRVESDLKLSGLVAFILLVICVIGLIKILSTK